MNKKTLTKETEIQAFFERFGVSEEEFKSNFRSFGVESALKRAKNLTHRYKIRSVPILVVNGKYLTGGPSVEHFDDMLGVTNELIQREKQRL